MICEGWSLSNSQPGVPIQPAILGPKASPNPSIQKMELEISTSRMFLTATLVLFLVLTIPASRQRKPAYIMNTGATHSVIQTIVRDSILAASMGGPNASNTCHDRDGDRACHPLCLIVNSVRVLNVGPEVSTACPIIPSRSSGYFWAIDVKLSGSGARCPRAQKARPGLA